MAKLRNMSSIPVFHYSRLICGIFLMAKLRNMSSEEYSREVPIFQFSATGIFTEYSIYGLGRCPVVSGGKTVEYSGGLFVEYSITCVSRTLGGKFVEYSIGLGGARGHGTRGMSWDASGLEYSTI